jgi:hypothetical protein
MCQTASLAQSRVFKQNTIDELREKHPYGEKPKVEQNTQSETTQSTVTPIFNTTFFIILGIILLLFIVFLFIGNKTGILFKKERFTKNELNFEELSIEQTSKSELELLLENALSQKNYKVAIRALYLLTLKHLSDTTSICLKDDKTNYDYFYEIKNKKTKELFRSITSVYDYVWYGEFEAENTHYRNAANFYEQLNQQSK